MAILTGHHLVLMTLLICVVGAVTSDENHAVMPENHPLTSEDHACNVEGAVRCLVPIDFSRMRSPEFNFIAFSREMMLPFGMCLDKLLREDCARVYDTPELTMVLKIFDHHKLVEYSSDIRKLDMKCNRHIMPHIILCFAKFYEGLANDKVMLCPLLDVTESCFFSVIKGNCDVEIGMVETVVSYMKDYAECPQNQHQRRLAEKERSSKKEEL